MRLYHSAGSPFVRKVMVTVHELGLLDQVELVPAAGNPVAPGTMPAERNPLGKVPTLEREDGPALYDSPVICAYLNDAAGGGLYPAKPRLWESLTLEATGDGIMDAAVLMRYETTIWPDETRPAWLDAQWLKVTRTLDALEARWMSHLAGQIDIGQVAIGCALGYLDFRHDARAWRTGRPALAAWAARFSERPSMQATLPA